MPEVPLFLVLTAPSGAGKSTLIKLLKKEFTNFVYSVSCTTRAPRGEEKDGEAYHFLSEEEFLKRVADGDFLEYALVHDHYYGTLKEAIEKPMQVGKSVLLDIDVAGAAQVREIVKNAPENSLLKRSFLDVFIDILSIEVLKQRLEKRGEDTPEVIEKRLKNAIGERARKHEFSAIVVNDELEKAERELHDCICKKVAQIKAGK